MSRRSNQKPKEPISKLPKTEYELIIDSEDTYKDLDNISYIHPSHLSMIKSLSSNQYSRVSIKNTHVDDITPYVLLNLYGKVKVDCQIEIIVYQPVAVMQFYDAKQLEANALLAGFADVKINDTTYVDYKTQRKMDTLSVSFIKPKRRTFEGENVEVSSTSEVNTSSKKRTNSSRKK
jgi:hypothetical protein